MLRTQWGRVRALCARTFEDDRGDVPGWVLVTLVSGV